MYQMICRESPGHASDGAVTGAEIDEVRGGIPTRRGVLGQGEAAEILGVSWHRYRRGRRVAAWGGPRRGGRRWTRLQGCRCRRPLWDFTAKHSTLVSEHGCGRSYNWVRLTLQAHGRMRPAPRRGAHRRKRPRRALPGMMVQGDEWVAFLIVTMDTPPARCLCRASGRSEAMGEPLWHRGRRGGGQGQPDPGRLRHRAMAYSRGGGGPSAWFGTLQMRLPQEPGSPASPTWRRPTVSSRRSTCPSTTPASRCPRPRARPSFPSPARSTTSSASRRSAPSCRRRLLQLPADRHRRHYVKAQVRVHEYPDGTLAVFRPPMPGAIPGRREPNEEPAGRPADATGRRPVDPGPPVHLVLKPVNSECARADPSTGLCGARGAAPTMASGGGTGSPARSASSWPDSFRPSTTPARHPAAGDARNKSGHAERGPRRRWAGRLPRPPPRTVRMRPDRDTDCPLVMVGLGPTIHEFFSGAANKKTWMVGLRRP